MWRSLALHQHRSRFNVLLSGSHSLLRPSVVCSKHQQQASLHIATNTVRRSDHCNRCHQLPARSFSTTSPLSFSSDVQEADVIDSSAATASESSSSPKPRRRRTNNVHVGLEQEEAPKVAKAKRTKKKTVDTEAEVVDATSVRAASTENNEELPAAPTRKSQPVSSNISADEAEALRDSADTTSTHSVEDADAGEDAAFTTTTAAPAAASTPPVRKRSFKPPRITPSLNLPFDPTAESDSSFMPLSQSEDPFNSSFNSFTPTSTFVSSHYRIDPADVLKYIGERKGLSYVKAGGNRINVKDCPFCKPTKNKPDNQYKLTVWLDTGSHNCLRCGSKGSWFDFKKKLGDIPNVTNVMGDKVDGRHAYQRSMGTAPPDAAAASETSSASSRFTIPIGGISESPSASNSPASIAASSASPSHAKSPRGGPAKLSPPLPVQAIVHQYPSNLFLPKFEPVLKYLLETRGLATETLRHYQIGACIHKFPNPDKNGMFEEQQCITMPWIKTREQLEEIRIQMDPELWKQHLQKKEKQKKKGGATDEQKKIVEEAAFAATTAAAQAQPVNVDTLQQALVSGISSTSTTDAASFTAATASASSPPSLSPFANQVTERIKLRSLVHKGNQRLLPSGGMWNFFGWHTVPMDAEELVITEGEFDAMAVWQATRLPAVSLPNGARSLPVELLPLLEKFKRIYLWLDDDAAGREGADKFAKKLGVGRCLIVKSSLPRRKHDEHSGLEETMDDDLDEENKDKPQPKDANDALRQGVNLKALVAAAQPLRHEQILRFADIRSEVLREFTDPFARRGVQSRYLPGLNRILKGHRPGELTIITGATGVGKTTVLSQISLDYCSQGVNTLWGSFEIRNTKLARTMISQYANMNFSTEIPANNSSNANAAAASESSDPDGAMGLPGDRQSTSEPLVPQPVTAPAPDPNVIRQFNLWADRFEQLPLYFMKFFGSNTVETVLDAMEYAVYVYDVEHILLDNLQFMLSEQGKGYDRFENQDRAIALFRHFASTKNVHITLVIHPRKEHDNHALGVSSIFGGAKATQEADNILIIQKPVSVDENAPSSGMMIAAELARIKAELGSMKSQDGSNSGDESWMSQHRRIEIKKNRFDGEVGVIPFRYDKKTCRIHEVGPGQGRKNQSGNQSGSTDSSSSGGNSGYRPPAAVPIRAPRPTRSFVFGQTQSSNDAAQATENANRAAEASMRPKPKAAPKAKPVKFNTQSPVSQQQVVEASVIDINPTSVESMSAEASQKKPRTRKKSASAESATPEDGSANGEGAAAAPVKAPRKPRAKKVASTEVPVGQVVDATATPTSKKAAPVGVSTLAPTLSSPHIEIVAE